ncbi:hypothetical protein [Culicoidibacter larvae]|uniref:Uncharacterized protein n=1 Tax=Culicoidibacter larvae TaxID=2579976 RepID=A0A5R8Q826_9FIRM|nr:hypothetical protein [Culicoidibacter larvae]TLG71291.1 hypothetical protein FEZ08_11110 [Culicoidibacter larvae]
MLKKFRVWLRATQELAKEKRINKHLQEQIEELHQDLAQKNNEWYEEKRRVDYFFNEKMIVEQELHQVYQLYRPEGPEQFTRFEMYYAAQGFQLIDKAQLIDYTKLDAILQAATDAFIENQKEIIPLILDEPDKMDAGSERDRFLQINKNLQQLLVNMGLLRYYYDGGIYIKKESLGYHTQNDHDYIFSTRGIEYSQNIVTITSPSGQTFSCVLMARA